MASETSVQTIVHKLEEGVWRKWVYRALVVAFLSFIVYLWMFRGENGFRGLSHEKAMEQAQIAREIARGNGFTTKMIRPAALYQFRENNEPFNQDRIQDAYHAPLNPLLNAPFLALVKKHWPISLKDKDYLPDRVLVMVQMGLMMLGWLVSYLTMKRLFDARLAAFGAWLMILCQTFWDFALSGLPQNLIFFLFSGASYCLVRAVENKVAQRQILAWLTASTVCFGLMALTHALTLWIFAGAVLFAGIYFPSALADQSEGNSEGVIRRILSLPLKALRAICNALKLPAWLQNALLRPAPFLMVALVVLMYAPWMVRNYKVCGNPVGLGWYSGLQQVKGSESGIMRSMEPPFDRTSPYFFRAKVQSQLSTQTGQLLAYLGGIITAPIFFLALMHTFKREDTGAFRWALFSMWAFALVGMAVFGLEGKPTNQPYAPPVEANDLHIVFAPLFAAYGMAFLLVMWSRLEIHVKLVRWAFIAVIFLISGQRFVQTFITFYGQQTMPIQWPPYYPQSISLLNQWTTEREVISSDVPWAVSWYADRKSLWLPQTIKDFVTLNDDNQLNSRIVGLYLTPMSGNAPLMGGIVKGDYKEWAPFIMRQIGGPALRDFPLRVQTAMPIDGECIFYSDRDRWTIRED